MKRSAYASMRTMQEDHWWWRGMAHLYRTALDTALETGGVPLTPAPSPCKEGKGKTWYLSPSLFTGEGFGVGDNSAKSHIPTLNWGTERKIIDVGCGFGANLRVLNQFGSVVGVDISLNALRSISQRPALGLVQARADALPFRANSFDVVALLAVIEHVERDHCALTESHRVARRGAIQILLTSAFMLLWSHHDAANKHYRRYRAACLDQLQQATGWHILLTSYVTASVFPLVTVIRTLQRILKTRARADYDMGPESRWINVILEGLLRAESG